MIIKIKYFYGFIRDQFLILKKYENIKLLVN